MKYVVRIIRTTIQESDVEVEASSDILAATIAYTEAQKQVNGEKNSLPLIDWELSSDLVDLESVDEA